MTTPQIANSDLRFHACAGCLSRNLRGKLLNMQFLQGGSRPWSPQILPAPTCTRRGLFFRPLPAPVEANLRPRFFVDKVAGRCCGLLVPAPPVAPIPIPPKPRTGATLDGWKFRCLILLGHGMLGSLYRPSSCGCAGTPKRSYGFAVCV